MNTRSTLVWTFTLALLGTLVLNGPSFGQNADQDRPRGDQKNADPNRGGPERRPGGDRGRFDPQEMQARMAQALKERLKAGDEEWAIIQPRLTKVTELRIRSGGGFGGSIFGFRGGPGGPGGPGGDRGPGGGDRPGGDRGPGGGGGDQSEIGQKARALNDLLQKESVKPEEVKKALGDLRKAREKQEAELKKAREELREVLTLQQEAALVVMGILD